MICSMVRFEDKFTICLGAQAGKQRGGVGGGKMLALHRLTLTHCALRH